MLTIFTISLFSGIYICKYYNLKIFALGQSSKEVDTIDADYYSNFYFVPYIRFNALFI